MRKLTGAVFLGITLLMGVGIGAGAEFPNKNITIIVHSSPGGGFDSLARAIGRSMKNYLPKHVKVIVKNVVGAGNVTGTVAMYRAKPDGYTIGHLNADGLLGLQILNPQRDVGYDVNKFTTLARVGGEAYGILVRKDSPYRSLKDLQQAKRVTWGVEAIGVTRWLPAFMAAKELGIPFAPVSGYGGTGESFPALLRGDYDVFLQPIDHPSTVPLLKSGDARALVNLDKQRAKNAPDTPTAIELGHNVVIKLLRTMVAPPGLPADKATKLEHLLLKAMADKDYKDFIAGSGIDLVPGNAQEANADLQGFVEIYDKYKEPMLKELKKK